MLKMAHKILKSVLIFLILPYTLIEGCGIDGLSNFWADINVLDTDRGTIFEGNTTDILSIISAEHTGDDLYQAPYFNVSFENSMFALKLSDSFALYEEYETSQSMSVSIVFECNDGQTANYIFIIDIKDTNNNAPVFINEEIVYSLPSPLPVGYQISGCTSEIIVRDIDLTTQSIEFNIENNDAFEIFISESDLTERKQFVATLQTRNYIRSFIEPIILNISATDVDQTNDPPLTTYTTITLQSNSEVETHLEPKFPEAYYLANYTQTDGLNFEKQIFLEEGYSEDVVFSLTGDFSELFTVTNDNNSIYVELISNQTNALDSLTQIILTLKADSDVTGGDKVALIITLDDVAVSENREFSKALYKGRLLDNTLIHEYIFVSNFNETELSIEGDLSVHFLARVTTGVVEVTLVNTSLELGSNISYIVLELFSDDVRTVLLIDIEATETSEPPEVKFESENYVIELTHNQTGLIAICKASSSNNEEIVYSIVTDIDEIQQRVGINSLGEIYLFATIETGVYDFIVSAVTLESQVSTSAEVLMMVNSEPESNEDLVLAPFIVIEINEEQSYDGLIDFNHTDCLFELHNNWPENNDWVYLEGTKLKTKPIDREDTAISHMTVSQVQAQVIMNCNEDVQRRKRDLGSEYESYSWLLMKSIEYNPKKSVINIIVNDINDNYPVFEQEDGRVINVGYPDSSILDIIQPRALIYLQASDADIGINAELVYWTSSDQVVVSPTSGSVHAKSSIIDGDEVTIYATDQLGAGLTGEVDVKIRILKEEHIAVVTIPNSFLEDEEKILDDISEAMGYNVKSLHSSVSVESNENARDSTRGITVLKLFLYGLLNGEPITVEKLTGDINNSTLLTTEIESSVSLKKYINSYYSIERNKNLLIAIFVVGALLFIAFLLFFILKWFNCFEYQKLSEVNSFTSQSDWVDGKFAIHPSAINNVELRSQLHLQQMIKASSGDPEIVTIQIDRRNNFCDNKEVDKSFENETFKAFDESEMSNSKVEMTDNRKNIIKESMTDETSVTPTVSFLYPINDGIDENEKDRKLNKRRASNSNPFYIQLKDKLKGELDADSEAQRRKSVVTFDENVKKILHFDNFIGSNENSRQSEFSRI